MPVLDTVWYVPLNYVSWCFVSLVTFYCHVLDVELPIAFDRSVYTWLTSFGNMGDRIIFQVTVLEVKHE